MLVEMKKVLLLLLLSVALPLASHAQVDREVSKLAKVHFRQGATSLDENYMDNKSVLSEFAREVKAYCSDSAANFRQIRIVSSASPEGGKVLNDRIAKLRAEAITRWISREIAVDLEYEVESTSIDWDLLVALILEDDKVPYRDEVVELLKDTPVLDVVDGKEVELRYNALKNFKGGAPYQYILRNIFAELRYAAARCEFWWAPMPELTITSPVPMRFSANGAEGVVTYDKSMSDDVVPTITATDGWIDDIVPTGAEATFVVAPNRTAEPRTTSIIVDCYGVQQEVVVQQEAAVPMLTLAKSSAELPAAESVDIILYEKSVDDDVYPVATCAADWVDSITTTDDAIKYSVTQNTSEEPRSVTMFIDSYGLTQEFAISQAGAESQCKHPFYMSIKTNMLYDVAAVPNIGVEFYLGKNFSVVGNWHYAWWKSDPKSWYWRTYGGDAAIRYWLGKQSRIKPLTGHHLGVYGQMLTYDIELGNKGILADKWSWTVGVEYGYSLPIARRLNLDFTLGLGYHWGLFDEYLPVEGHYVWQATKRRQYLGPTKLEVSLVWLIGCGNYNKGKGGRK